jgi:hypothetical protein
MSEYADWTVEELREEASAREIEGRSEMNKDDLVKALEENDGGGGVEAVETAPPPGFDPDNPGGQGMEVPPPPAEGE